MEKYLIKLYKFFTAQKLPTSKELFEKSRVYAEEECILQNLFDADEIIIARGHYCHGYQQAIKDFVNNNYKGIDE